MPTLPTGTGIWSAALRYGEAEAIVDAAAELEELGYTAQWIPDIGGDLFESVERLLGATRNTVVATGILNLWMHEPQDTATAHAALSATHGDRFLVGIGISHAPLIDGVNSEGTYTKPLARTTTYLDDLDAAQPPLPASARVLAALGPRMVELARARSAGAHPYLVTPEHTQRTRDALGDGGYLAVEQGVVLETDATRAREIARTNLAGYLQLPNYTNNWKRIGFTDDDIAEGGSDRLVDALVAWGDEATIAARVDAQRDAGADHVCVQVLTDDARQPALDEWRRLAPVLL